MGNGVTVGIGVTVGPVDAGFWRGLGVRAGLFEVCGAVFVVLGPPTDARAGVFAACGGLFVVDVRGEGSAACGTRFDVEGAAGLLLRGAS